MEVTTSGCSLLLSARSITGAALDCTPNRGAVNMRRDGPPHCGHGIDAGGVPIDAWNSVWACSVQPYSCGNMCGPLGELRLVPFLFRLGASFTTDDRPCGG